MKYSQNSEEDYILAVFSDKPDGKFLDIGGYNPFKFSNTRALYEKGWSGVYVEPSPSCFQSFVKEYENDDRITLINAAVSDGDSEIKFFDSGGDAISTSDIGHRKIWEAHARINYTEITVKTIGMERLLLEHGKDVDFISIDTESTNLKMFKLLPDYFLSQIKAICIEHDNNVFHIERILKMYGFKTIYQNAENIICSK